MKDSNIKIFISAYACEPDLGSEIGVGWNWVLEMSKYFNIWVLTRASNQHSIETWIENNKEYKNINFIYFDLPYFLRFWKKKKRGVRAYYNLWQMFSNSIVKQTMQRNNIEIFHHLTYGNALWRVSSYGQQQFFIWGPVGGLETIGEEFSRHYGKKGRIIEFIRRSVIKLLPIHLAFKKQCVNANLILCKTDISKIIIDKYAKGHTILFTDVAIDETKLKVISTPSAHLKETNQVNYLVVGNLDSWRGFDLLIEAFSLAVQIKNNIKLTVVGMGQDKETIEKLIAMRSLTEHVIMAGSVTMDEYNNLITNADVVVNPSLKEGAVTVSFDSMALGKPLICLDTTGYTRYFSEGYAIKIPLLSDRLALITLLKDAIIKLEDKKERLRMSLGCKTAASDFTWHKRGIEIKNTIEKAYGKSE